MWKKILLGIVGFIVISIGLAMWATSGLTDTATAFFDKVKAHDYKTAYYGYLSEDFKGNVPLEKFKIFMETNHLDKFKMIDWGNRETSNNTGKLEGTLVMPDGSSLPITIGFVKGEDRWKIYAISKPAAGLQETEQVSTTRETQEETHIPSKLEYIQLARETVKQVSNTLKTKNSLTFYNSISELWRSQISPQKFQELFNGLINAKINLTPLEAMTPVEYKPAFLDKNKLLNVQIFYPNASIPIAFDLQYINENGIWKLFGIDIHGRQTSKQ